jgi:hypothetical protein
MEDNAVLVEDNGTCVGDNANRVEAIEAAVDVALPHPFPCKAFGKDDDITNRASVSGTGIELNIKKAKFLRRSWEAKQRRSDILICSLLFLYLEVQGYTLFLNIPSFFVRRVEFFEQFFSVDVVYEHFRERQEKSLSDFISSFRTL